MAAEGEAGTVERLHVLPVGAVPEPLLRGLLAATSRRVRLACHLLPPLDDGGLPRLADRDQFDADRLLGVLDERAADVEGLLVGLTARDLGSPLFTHFFGRARRGGRVALVSLARLTPAFYGLPDDPALTVRRGVLEILHEVGHLAGLPHCRDYGCLMRFAPTVEAIDVRGADPCPRCLERMPAALRPRLEP